LASTSDAFGTFIGDSWIPDRSFELMVTPEIFGLTQDTFDCPPRAATAPHDPHGVAKMHWSLEPEHEELREMLAGWLQRVAPSDRVRRWLDEGDTETFPLLLAREGWTGLGAPEAQGGQGGGLLELAILAEELGATAAPSGSWMATVLALPALAGGAAASVLEDGGSAALVVRADRPIDTAADAVVAAGDRLSGHVSLVLGGAGATVLVVPTDQGLYQVAADTPGVSVAPAPLLDRSRSVADILFDDVPAARLDSPADLLRTASARAAVLVAADALGALRRMREMAVEYSGQREQFGVPVGSFQAMKHAAATMLVAEEAARSIVYFAAASVDAGHERAALHAAAAKAQVTAHAADAADSALTMHGAIGYTWEHDLQLLFKRAKLDRELFGAPARWNDRIAKALLSDAGTPDVVSIP
jgi:alkylation response protein AidB-like acyl-CoA dehydrogenase